MITVRMQCCDYKHKFRFLKTLKEVVQTERHKMFYKGLAPNLMGQCYLYCSVIAGHFLKQQDYGFLCPLVFLLTSAMAHPFFVLSMRLLHGTAHHNIFSLLVALKHKQGLGALYRGFLPSLFIYFFMFFFEYSLIFNLNKEQIFEEPVVTLEIKEKQGEDDLKKTLDSYNNYGDWLEQRKGETRE